MTEKLNLPALAALVMAYALGPMATQMLMPTVPFVHRDFDTSLASAQLLITMAFLTIALMTLVYGPLSDRYGRRPVLRAGILLFVAGSLISVFAQSLTALVVGRMLQAAGSSAGLALTRTVIHDVYGREGTGRILAYVTMVMILVPMLSPVAGGVLLDHFSWRTVFAFCSAVGLVTLLMLWVAVPETRKDKRSNISVRGIVADFASLLRLPAYLSPALYFGFSMAMFFAFQGAVPYLMVEVLDCPATEYGIWFAALCAAYVGGNFVTGKLSKRLNHQTLMAAGGLGSLAAVLAGFAALRIFELSTALVFIPALAFSFTNALAIAHAQAEAVSADPARSGAASGLMSCMQMLIGAAAVQLVGVVQDGSAYPVYALLCVLAVAAMGTLLMPFLALRLRRPNPATSAACAP